MFFFLVLIHMSEFFFSAANAQELSYTGMNTWNRPTLAAGSESSTPIVLELSLDTYPLSRHRYPISMVRQ